MPARANPQHLPAGLIARMRYLDEVWPMIDEPVGVRREAVASSRPPDGPGNYPARLLYWGGDALAAGSAIYAIGNLVFIADAGLHSVRSTAFFNRSGADCDAHSVQWRDVA